MRVEIDIEDLALLVQQFLIKEIPIEHLLLDIEELVTFSTDYDFKHDIEITEL